MLAAFKRLSLIGRFACALCLSTLLVRLISLGLYPLMDTTEARYGEMARIMVETGNWVTPMFDYGIPFWGKPPMFTWLSAAGFSLLGINEFAARLPHLLVGFGVLLLVWKTARLARQNSSDAWLAAAILASTTAFSLISGAVMTDTALTLGITLAMVSFWRAWQQQGRHWGYLFFVGLAIGLMSKGPLTLVLVGISLFLWLVPEGRWRHFTARLPLLTGPVLMLALTLPWYMIAEQATPGFLNYFLVGEHFKRFVVSGWQGDLYGTAHKEVRGMIWLLWLITALPWTPILLTQFAKIIRVRERHQTTKTKGLIGYAGFLWSWMLAPLILFTFSGNILYSYIMPGLPAMALLIVHYQSRLCWSPKVFLVGCLTPALLLAASVALLTEAIPPNSQKPLLQAALQTQPEIANTPLYYLKERPFSGQFYSQGKAKLLAANHHQPPYYLVVKGSINSANSPDASHCEQRHTWHKHRLYYCY
ncbi:glycosyltransferase family 39 protein [Corallincola platygyrae]|uniref:Glycosyltransferase family 39 protein n=1 Tax=Corallincola platygyrae TaxID=1193278 RepID=A0ABW4XMK1_9GAMM